MNTRQALRHLITRTGYTMVPGAYDTLTGRELWRTRLPAGGQATPITYMSGPSGRQFVVIAAGGHSGLNTRVGDYVLGYALQKD